MDAIETKSLPVQLTNDEVMARGEELAGVCKEILAVEAAAKHAAAGFKGKIAALEARSAQLSSAIKNREEDREIEIREEKLYRDGMAQTIRCDTNAVISTRPLRPEEMTAWKQGKLSLVVETKPAVVVTTDPSTPPENR